MDENDLLLSETLQQLDEVSKMMPELLRQMAGLFEPPPWPREEMNTMYRLLAREADLPKRCRDPRCRRIGRCQGGLAAEGGDACAALWEEADLQKLEAACNALIVGWTYETRRLGEMANMILASKLVVDDEEPKGTKVQRAGRGGPRGNNPACPHPRGSTGSP
ncbi:hypothetical protein [Chelativorans alearense]|uniref:hypothetical protein n=1 Tax=Chelativorans alearense TaxID=2681495 RepID=UPI0013D7300D|nr:hypothetical protein [Chelativorans alearense]